MALALCDGMAVGRCDCICDHREVSDSKTVSSVGRGGV